MDCPACGAPGLPDGSDAVIDSSDGPLLLTRWQCAYNHWWHRTTDASPICAQGAECDPAEWLANEIAIALSRIYQPGQRPR
jgi:hypothetical protein